ncbi:YebB family permuted papain-like enzyme [Burkholderia cenocepacia]|uniref:YebB family permuted papain-like enzyme n=1 Tax=Burkholderia sola TaxID=2843302 RepID=A0ABV2C8N0_9BURK|nr:MULTISPECIES: YebB family permuted papain-like enzyme [unclassified Burkholderia]RQU69114.1 YebB family permuted papain-like enzyme [Burkholderia cenocepacia]MBP0607529.1 YebB family permuted papain-like enzyme [Burkholderia sp. CpTa8-5]MBP0717001.1 YebB family permuted papain-like enzyme [Burkholderia sp. AcTa6-5]RQU84412.1 YebB family permuted papain-like enzyme [Burkholderia cenocepacia]RQV16118.1 YebB family permuted papain-like enzyme [Burkholderia cenocepacia]
MVVDTGRQPSLVRSPGARRGRRFSFGSPESHAMPLPVEPEIGDIVFIRVTVRPFLEVASATRSWTNHVGIVVGERGGEALIAESTFPLSRVTTMSRFVARSDCGACVVARLTQPLDAAQRRRLVDAARRRIGVVYDTGFNLASRRQFCSRFVREIVRDATRIVLGDVETFDMLLRRNPGHPLGLWRIWYFGRIPWRRRTVTPASLFESDKLRVVADTRECKADG